MLSVGIHPPLLNDIGHLLGNRNRVEPEQLERLRCLEYIKEVGLELE